MRRQARIHFRGVYQQFFNNRYNTFTIEPAHIFDLQMLRARTLGLKCSLRSGHPILGECSDLAYIEVNIDGWKRSCHICATGALGFDEISQTILHPDIRSLRSS